LIYHSLLSGYQEGINSGFDKSSRSAAKQRIFMRNASITFLFQEAASGRQKLYDTKRTIFEVKDPSVLRYPPHTSPEIDEWQRKNLYCYDLVVPDHLADSIDDIMRSEIGRLFPQYSVDVLKRDTVCLVLIQTDKTDKLKSTRTAKEHKMLTTGDGCTVVHGSLDVLVKRLDAIYMRAPIPVMNGTDITYPIDLDLQVNFSNLKELNAALMPYDLQFVKKDWPIEFLVIKDTIAKTNKL
jgi:hypothetical protein